MENIPSFRTMNLTPVCGRTFFVVTIPVRSEHTCADLPPGPLGNFWDRKTSKVCVGSVHYSLQINCLVPDWCAMSNNAGKIGTYIFWVLHFRRYFSWFSLTSIISKGDKYTRLQAYSILQVTQYAICLLILVNDMWKRTLVNSRFYSALRPGSGSVPFTRYTHWSISRHQILNAPSDESNYIFAY